MYYNANDKRNDDVCKGQYSIKVRMYIPGKGYFIHWNECYAQTGNQAIQITVKYILHIVKYDLAGEDKNLQRLYRTISKILKKEGIFFVQNWEYKVVYPTYQRD